MSFEARSQMINIVFSLLNKYAEQTAASPTSESWQTHDALIPSCISLSDSGELKHHREFENYDIIWFEVRILTAAAHKSLLDFCCALPYQYVTAQLVSETSYDVWVNSLWPAACSDKMGAMLHSGHTANNDE